MRDIQQSVGTFDGGTQPGTFTCPINVEWLQWTARTNETAHTICLIAINAMRNCWLVCVAVMTATLSLAQPQADEMAHSELELELIADT